MFPKEKFVPKKQHICFGYGNRKTITARIIHFHKTDIIANMHTFLAFENKTTHNRQKYLNSARWDSDSLSRV